MRSTQIANGQGIEITTKEEREKSCRGNEPVSLGGTARIEIGGKVRNYRKRVNGIE